MQRRDFPAGFSRFVFLLTALVALLFSSCASEPRIATFLLKDGVQQYFVHQVTIRKKGVLMQIDATIHVRDLALVDNPVVRYTLYDEVYGQVQDDVLVSLERSNQEFICRNPKIIYRDVELNGVRFETEMEPNDFTDMVYAPDSVFLVFKNKNGDFLGKVESKKLQESFDKLRSVVNKN